ncbi:MAG: hypothetical protein GXP14_02625 [Gammaproteobacteria bacterium]|nr:hypothetical protein [Gammaproteobacteria bacterium]
MSTDIFKSFQFEGLTLTHRLVMAPVTRNRAGLDDGNELGYHEKSSV